MVYIVEKESRVEMVMIMNHKFVACVSPATGQLKENVDRNIYFLKYKIFIFTEDRCINL